MRLEEAIAAIEACSSFSELRAALQTIIENYGFAAFNFLDTGSPHLDVPFFNGTTGQPWERDYQSNLFVHVDHCLTHARRTNTPFTWDSVPLPKRSGKRKPGSHQLMEAALDHGFQNGLIVPYHFVDSHGRMYSSLVVLFWKDPARRLRFLLRHHTLELHLLTVYWAQRAVQLVASEFRGRAITDTDGPDRRPGQLTDRERDILAWAARGKTVADTADIMTISEETVNTHMKSILRKLNASNKTHAVARAILLNVIDV